MSGWLSQWWTDGWAGEGNGGQSEVHDDGENVTALIPMYLPPASDADCVSILLYQLLSGEGSLCMAFFFMLSRYSCCDTAKTDANISSSSQSVRPVAKQEQQNTLWFADKIKTSPIIYTTNQIVSHTWLNFLTEGFCSNAWNVFYR